MGQITCQTREEWLAARKFGIGSSDAAIVLGLFPFGKSPMDLYCQKVGLIEDSAEETEAIEMGILMEPVIAERYTRVTKRTLQDPGRFTVYQSDETPWLLASPDRLVMESERGSVPGVLELKSRGFWKPEEWANGEPPLLFTVQVMHQMMVLRSFGFEWGSLAVIAGGHKFIWADVEWNQTLADAMLEEEKEFMRRVELKDPPPPDHTESCKALLRVLYPKAEPGKVVALPEEAEIWDAKRMNAVERIKDATRTKDEADNWFKAQIGDAEKGVLHTGVEYTLKGVEKHATKAVAVGDLISSYRELRRKEPKG